jgi:hypothetical protein
VFTAAINMNPCVPFARRGFANTAETMRLFYRMQSLPIAYKSGVPLYSKSGSPKVAFATPRRGPRTPPVAPAGAPAVGEPTPVVGTDCAQESTPPTQRSGLGYIRSRNGHPGGPLPSADRRGWGGEGGMRASPPAACTVLRRALF